MNWLQITWFILIAYLLVGYTILDGFDLGVGIWYPFSRGDAMRRTMLNTIAPVWDGNEVWLVTLGAALFAAFPPVYAVVFSTFYLALMLLLFALILRGVSIEFASKEETAKGRRRWDVAFSLGSTLAVLLLGVALGNILRGLPVSRDGVFFIPFFSLLNPFALLVGILNLVMLATHGALYLVLKTEGKLAKRATAWSWYAWAPYLLLSIVTIVTGAVTQQHLLRNFRALPILWIVPLLAIIAIIMIAVWNKTGNARRAFISSSLSIAALLGTAAIALFPIMVPAANDPAQSLTVANSSSSTLTLSIMLGITLTVMTVVTGYTIWVYRIFGGKVTEEAKYY